jgi:hypothetical protein
MTPSRSLLLALALLAASCGNRSTDDDKASVPNPSPAGQGPHIADVSDPAKKTHAMNGANVSVTGVVVTAVDNNDETRDGKSRGAIYVQDLESHAAFAGIELYKPSFVPASLVVGPGDVVDLTGQYQENHTLGSTVTFPNMDVLPEIGTPSGSFRFESAAPDPTPIPISDLLSFETGRKWIGQLVIIKDVTLTAAVTNSNGRITAPIAAPGDGGNDAPTITNELMQIDSYAAGQHFTSVTGIVTYFYNLHIAPRSKADIIQ